MIDRIDHFVITVADLERTLSFYERVLGFQRVIASGRPAALTFGTQKINVHQAGSAFEPKARQPTAGAADFCLIASRPLAAVRAHLEREGVTIELGPVTRTGALGEMMSLYFRDPDGNLIEISEYTAQGGSERGA
jgi:catechol 2,3-dioxygenase-like lactoylglutathione lyase family enzyme